MEKNLKEMKDALNEASGQAAVMNVLLMALIAQTPDKDRLLRDFEEMAEDTTIRAMYSSHPETFFQAARAAATTWAAAIREE